MCTFADARKHLPWVLKRAIRPRRFLARWDDPANWELRPS
jgi:hypothetical protein